jgi:hypothetical protein
MFDGTEGLAIRGGRLRRLASSEHMSRLVIASRRQSKSSPDGDDGRDDLVSRTAGARSIDLD